MVKEVPDLAEFLPRVGRAATHLKLGRSFRLHGQISFASIHEEKAESCLTAWALGPIEEMVSDLLLTVWEGSTCSDPAELPEWADIQKTIALAEYFLWAKRKADTLGQSLLEECEEVTATQEELWGAVWDIADWNVHIDGAASNEEGWKAFKELGYTYGFL